MHVVAEKVVVRLDIYPFARVVGVEPQVEHLLQRREQLGLRDRVVGYVGRHDGGTFGGRGREYGRQTALLGERHALPLARSVQIHPREAFGRRGGDPFGRRLHRHVHLGATRLFHVTVVHGPVARIGGAAAVGIAYLQLALRSDGRRGHHRFRRASRPRSDRNAPAHQAIGRARLVLEYDAHVFVPRHEGGATVAERVREAEPYVAPRIDVHRIEPFQPLAREDAVVGGVLQPELEPRGHRRHGGEARPSGIDREDSVAVVELRAVGRVGRIDEVAERVGQHQRRHVYPPQRVGRGRRLARAARAKPHRRAQPRGRRGAIAAAHAEAAKLLARHELAPQLVTRVGEDALHESLDGEKRHVVRRAHHPLRRVYARRAVRRPIFVAVHGQELNGRIVAPAVLYRLARECERVIPESRPYSGPCRPFGPLARVARDADRVVRRAARPPRSRKPNRAAQQLRAVALYRPLVPRRVEPLDATWVERIAQKSVVARRGGQTQRDAAARARAFGIGQRVEVVKFSENGFRIFAAQVARHGVDLNGNHNRPSSPEARISTSTKFISPPCSVALSVASETRRVRQPLTARTSGDATASAMASACARGS